MLDSVKFQLSQVVYLIVSPDVAGMVTGILFRPHGVVYYVSWGTAAETQHYDIELTTEKSFVTEEN